MDELYHGGVVRFMMPLRVPDGRTTDGWEVFGTTDGEPPMEPLDEVELDG